MDTAKDSAKDVDAVGQGMIFGYARGKTENRGTRQRLSRWTSAVMSRSA